MTALRFGRGAAALMMTSGRSFGNFAAVASRAASSRACHSARRAGEAFASYSDISDAKLDLSCWLCSGAISRKKSDGVGSTSTSPLTSPAYFETKTVAYHAPAEWDTRI